ncbi:MAG TPA: YfiR family protein [Candidatus Acidoferrum sp.]|nr:YfiR family protein [Candidatus Acidoferrum sp.]
MTSLEKRREVGEFQERRESRLAGRVKDTPLLGLLLCLVLALVLVPEAALAQDSAGEYELKAAMLFNLTRFVEWPAAAYADAQAPTVLCILGRDPFGDSLTSMASSQSAGGRAVQIRRIANSKETRGCHVVYISSSERKNIAQILAVLKGTSVLTVGEMGQFAARGGMIQFSLEEKQVRFEVNLEAASEADLKISSRLLVLARVVKDPNKGAGREGSALWSPSFEVAATQAPKCGSKWGLADALTPENSGDEAEGRR